MTSPRFRVSILAILFASITGCGGRELAEVRGTVSANGRPVTGGTLVFSPIATSEEQPPGKSATGDIQPDGTFQLSTYDLHDGAIVGRHRVRFIPPIEDEDKKVDSPSMTTTSSSRLTLPADYEVEIDTGRDNEISIELVPRSPN
jgi:hypothetical protein